MMKLTNRTTWSTADLRVLIAAALEADGIGARKLAKTLAAKWRTKVRYYERRAAARRLP